MSAVLHIAARPFTHTAGASALTNYGVIGDSQYSDGSGITEAKAQTTVRAAGTWGQFSGLITANTLSVAATYVTRVNGANGNQTFSVGSGTTGEFADAA